MHPIIVTRTPNSVSHAVTVAEIIGLFSKRPPLESYLLKGLLLVSEDVDRFFLGFQVGFRVKMPTTYSMIAHVVYRVPL